ncbi:MAG TPA: type II toxin-antitoxin system RelE/ParE family toxin [Pyrinomonadaceae bacterium]|nr:type II toxin-antitoxin system RelE/ParE family toxin [Pyrinomonadaceae bacterium]
MIEIRWTSQAADDLQAIFDFIERDSPRYALVIVEDILAGIDNLSQFPLLGRVVPERERNDTRELIKPPYRIVYEVTEIILILTIFRVSRSFPSDLK